MARCSNDIHLAFSDSLPFPDYYGHNWDAFWDVLSDGDYFPQKLTIKGGENLKKNLVNDYNILVKIFDNYNKTNLEDVIDLVWI